jgi:hypothetical protein
MPKTQTGPGGRVSTFEWRTSNIMFLQHWLGQTSIWRVHKPLSVMNFTRYFFWSRRFICFICVFLPTLIYSAATFHVILYSFTIYGCMEIYIYIYMYIHTHTPPWNYVPVYCVISKLPESGLLARLSVTLNIVLELVEAKNSATARGERIIKNSYFRNKTLMVETNWTL